MSFIRNLILVIVVFFFIFMLVFKLMIRRRLLTYNEFAARIKLNFGTIKQ